MDYSFTRADAAPRSSAKSRMDVPTLRKKARRSWGLIATISLIQGFLSLAHWFIFYTFTVFFPMSSRGADYLGALLFVLSISFTLGALLGFRHDHSAVGWIYKIAACWLGILNFLFWAAWLCWGVDLAMRLSGRGGAEERLGTAGLLFGLAILISLYGFINARWIRERRLTVALPNLPQSWQGRTALLISDMHLGNVNGARFARRIANLARRLNPDVVFIAGDLFDGSKCEAGRLAAPLFEMNPRFGVYFCGGNHEDFGDAAAYSSALMRGGIRVLHNQHVDIDGLRVIGISYSDSHHPLRLRAYLDSLELHNGPASILLNHVPHRLPTVESSGVSLQVSGHTHGGQIFPFTLIVRRVYREFTYGLQRFGKLQVLTSSGVGTWGPPMRVGSQPEVVLIK